MNFKLESVFENSHRWGEGCREGLMFSNGSLDNFSEERLMNYNVLHALRNGPQIFCKKKRPHSFIRWPRLADSFHGLRNWKVSFRHLKNYCSDLGSISVRAIIGKFLSLEINAGWCSKQFSYKKWFGVPSMGTVFQPPSDYSETKIMHRGAKPVHNNVFFETFPHLLLGQFSVTYSCGRCLMQSNLFKSLEETTPGIFKQNLSSRRGPFCHWGRCVKPTE